MTRQRRDDAALAVTSGRKLWAHWGYWFNVDAIDAGTGQWAVQAMDPQSAPFFNLVAPKR